jgi:signal transduction histidine kinase
LLIAPAPVEDLEIASQHKSQFVANMSHELRTPLAAMLGYAELVQQGFYGNHSEKSMDALIRIRSNGKHLLGPINTVLDIAKIESGQFTLNMAEYALERRELCVEPSFSAVMINFAVD